MVLKNMESLQIDFKKNVILREIWEEVMAEGEAAGMLKIHRGVLHTKFDRLPNWAEYRLEKATKPQIERCSKRFVHAESLEDAIGKR